MFNSIFSNESLSTPVQFLIMGVVSLISGLVYAYIISRKVRSSKRFFIVNTILPFVIGFIVAFVNGNIGVGLAVGGAFALIRFRSAPGTSEEIASIFSTMASGVAFGMGYLAYGAIILLTLAVIYIILSSTTIFDNKNNEYLLKITIPESLEYNDVFTKVFAKYLTSNELVGVKTTGMGSMFRLSYKVKLKDISLQKQMIDDLRVLNGNLEIQLLPYIESNDAL